MEYNSYGARALRKYAQDNPDNVVWSADEGWTDDHLTAEQLQRKARYSSDVDVIGSHTVFSESDYVGSFSNVCYYLRNASILLRAAVRPDERRVGAFMLWSPNTYAEKIDEELRVIVDESDDEESDSWESIQAILDTAEAALAMIGYSTVWNEGLAVVDMLPLNGRQRRIVEQGEFYRPDEDNLEADEDYLSDWTDFRNHVDPTGN